MKLFSNLCLIVAVSSNGVIGNSNTPGMIWHCREELRHFRDSTMGSVIVMGRITAETTGKLSGRDCIVLSTDPDYTLPGFTTMNIDDFLTYTQQNQSLSFMICGGGKVYDKLRNYCSNIIVSTMNFEADGDIKFFVPMEFELYATKEYDEFVVCHYFNYIY